mgnify:CR=1 FL=1
MQEKRAGHPARGLRSGSYAGSVDIDELTEAAAPRLGDLLTHLGSQKVTGSPGRGRASSPWRDSSDLNLAFDKGFITDHVAGKTWNPLQLLAEVKGLNLQKQDELLEAARELADFLGVHREGSGRRTERLLAAPKTPQKTVQTHAALVDAEALWKRLPREDEQAWRYLLKRHLTGPEELLRCSIGTSGNEFLDYQASKGYRCAFALRDPAGRIRSISVRFAGDASPGPKILNMKDAPVAGLAFSREGIRHLSSGDPEFQYDEVALVEGPTDTLALNLYLEEQGQTPFIWTLGAPGVGQAPAVIRAFSSAIKGRVIHVALDTDPAGEKRVTETARAAREAGARVVKRMTFGIWKDAAEAWSASHE